MNKACAQWRGDIGAYIVGALDSRASADVRRHLRRCENCRSEYEELLPVRDWLTQACGTNGTTAGRKPGGPVLQAVNPVRERKRWLWFAAIPAAAAAAAAIGVLTNESSVPVVPAFRAADQMTGVHGQARLQTTPAGTNIRLTVSGLPADERCRLVAVSRRGSDVAASWSAKYDGTASIIGTSAIPERQLTALRVESGSHRVLLIIALASQPRR